MHRISLPFLILGLLTCVQQERLNVLLLTLDTTRADHLGCYGHKGIETPAIDSLAARGVRYDSAYTVVPITLPSHLAMMSGTIPSYHGVRENGGFYVPEQMTTLAEILQQEGYDTAAFVGAFPLDSQTGLDQGFDLYDDNYPSRADGSHPRLSRFFDERPAADVARGVRSWLSEPRPRPFFLWSHFFDAHQPLTPPSPYLERYRHAPYDAEIASVDEAIGQILGKLEERGMSDNTLVILTADHGEGLGEHGEATHALLLYSSTLRVPLIVSDPTHDHSAVVEAPVSTLDIFSTVLDRLDIEIPSVNQGVPLPRSNDTADHQRQIISETLFGRLIYGWSPIYRLTSGTDVHISGPSQLLYDRALDPDELVDLGAQQAQRLDAHQRSLRKLRSEQSEGGFGFSSGHTSEETRSRLAALGYLGSVGATDDLSDEVDFSRPDPTKMMRVFDLQNEGHGLIDSQLFDLAIPILERAYALDPKNPAVLLNLAQAKLGLGDFDGGHQNLDELLEIAPEHTATRILLAKYHRDQGNFDRAAALLGSAVELDPSDQATKLLLAHLLEDAGREQDSVAAYRDLLDQDPSHTLAANGLATLLYRRGEAAAAIDLLRRVLDDQPYYAPAVLNLAVIYYERGEDDRASKLIQRALTLQPGYARALALRNMLHQSRTDSPPAAR